jgi:hypothetical protein
MIIKKNAAGIGGEEYDPSNNYRYGFITSLSLTVWLGVDLIVYEKGKWTEI